ncbi:MAG: ABC transporter ATP-binding protein [Actinomycetota bacterium]
MILSSLIPLARFAGTVMRPRHFRLLALSTAMTLAGIGLQTYLPVAFGNGLDRFFDDRASNAELTRLAVTFAAIFIAAYVLQMVAQWMLLRVSHELYRRLSVRGHDWLADDRSYQDQGFSSREQSLALDRGVIAIISAASAMLVGILPRLVELLIGAYLLSRVASVTTTAFALAIIVPTTLISVYRALTIGQLEQQYYARRLGAFGVLSDQVEKRQLFRRYRSTGYASHRLDGAHSSVLSAGLQVAAARRNLGLLQACALGAGAAGVIYSVGADVAAGEAGPGALLATALLYLTLATPSTALGEAVLTTVAGVVEGNQTLGALAIDDPRDMRRPAAGSHRPWMSVASIASDAIRVENVSVTGSDDASILSRLKLSIPVDGLTVVVGPTGSGKSTLCDVLAGVRTVSSGEIVLPAHLSTDQSIAAESQQPEFLDGSLRDSLTAASPGADDAELRRALSLDGHLDPSEIAVGLDDEIGSDALQLSGGQTKLLGVARSVLAARPLTVLDEPTSGMDDRLAHTVLRHVVSRGGGVVCATHDPRIVGMADHVIVLDGGRVMAQGTRLDTAALLAELGLDSSVSV